MSELCDHELVLDPGTLFLNKHLEAWHSNVTIWGMLRLHTHTLLLRTVIANYVVECILRAKTLQLLLTGTGQ